MADYDLIQKRYVAHHKVIEEVIKAILIIKSNDYMIDTFNSVITELNKFFENIIEPLKSTEPIFG